MKEKFHLNLLRFVAVLGVLFIGSQVSIMAQETKYAINITTPTNGTVVADKASAAIGETVTLTVTPNTGYEVQGGGGGGRAPKKASQQKIRSPQGNITVTQVDDTHYTFTLPETLPNILTPNYTDNTDFQVTATFSKRVITIDDSSEDGYDFTQNGVSDVVVKRTFKPGLNTLVLPFSLTQTEIEETFGESSKVYVLVGLKTDVRGGQSISLELTEGIEANVPCLLFTTIENNISELTFTDREVITSDSDKPSTECEGISLIGSYTTCTIAQDESNYVISGSKLYVVNKAVEMKLSRAYFHLEDPSGAKTISIDFGDGTTSIIDIADYNTQDTSSVVYDLSGRSVSKPSKGIYILNGKKIMIK